ncbi:MAG TPA: hypothetical protein PLT23_12250, partial [Lentisphaeria bacterium]|nr:hypothetical protein [Lentisphaeria bacterium]
MRSRRKIRLLGLSVSYPGVFALGVLLGQGGGGFLHHGVGKSAGALTQQFKQGVIGRKAAPEDRHVYAQGSQQPAVFPDYRHRGRKDFSTNL